MKWCLFALSALILVGCVTERDASSAPGGIKTIVPFAINKWEAPVMLANHLFYDRDSHVTFDVQINSIDGKAMKGDGQRTKYYYQVPPGPHAIAVSCVLAKSTWTADFDFVLDPGDSVEITGEVTDEGVFLWFADVNTGIPVTEKVRATAEPKKTYPAAS